MKRITIAGLCLATVFAFSAIAASSAYAGEYGKCVKVSEIEKHYLGAYEDKNCTKLEESGQGKYEWYPLGSEKFPGPVATTDSTKTATLESSLGNITCKKSTSAGELTGPKSDKDTTTFTSCEASKEKANSEGEPAGTIKTNLLDSTLVDHGELWHGKEPAEGEVWNCLVSSSDEPYLATFEFSKIKIRVSGYVCSIVTATNVMGTKTTDTFGKNTAPQEELVEYSLNEGASYEGPILGTQVATATIKTNEKLEVKGKEAVTLLEPVSAELGPGNPPVLSFAEEGAKGAKSFEIKNKGPQEVEIVKDEILHGKGGNFTITAHCAPPVQKVKPGFKCKNTVTVEFAGPAIANSISIYIAEYKILGGEWAGKREASGDVMLRY